MERLLSCFGQISPETLSARLIAEFGSTGSILAAAGSKRLDVIVTESRTVAGLVAASDVLHCVLSDRVLRGDLVSGGQTLHDYLRATMAFGRREVLRVLYLDGAHRVLKDEIAALGTVDGVPFHVREIIHRALDLGALGIVLAHNHPSGDPTITSGDVAATRKLALACAELGISLQDHLIVATGGMRSMRRSGVLD